MANLLADEAHSLRSRLLAQGGAIFQHVRSRYEVLICGGVDEELWADLCAQTLVWFQVTTELLERGIISRRGFRWILSHESSFWQQILRNLGALQKDAPSISPLLCKSHPSASEQIQRWLKESSDSGGIVRFSILFEQFLAACHPLRRKRHGAFYTPPEVAGYVVQRVDASLRSEFALPEGLADAATWGSLGLSTHPPNEPFVRILDPAAGAGVFLVAAVERIHQTWQEGVGRCLPTDSARRGGWNEYVTRQLLPRLFGLELSPAACLAATLEIAHQLEQTGYEFHDAPPLQLFTANTLAQADDGCTAGTPMTVIVGNPPFAALSQNRSAWIERLLKGEASDGRPVASYFEVNGQPLAERKHWLHDDYVKFLRYAQWRIESAGCGVVGFVTNHGYLDNPTFRGVRRQLMQAFPHIEVLDLHGNRKKRETAPNGAADENVFQIEQGVALSLLCRPPQMATKGSPPQGSRVLHGDVWGTRAEKCEQLLSARGKRVSLAPLAPTPPFYFFAPREETHREEYEQGWRLTEAMPVYVAAPVTARDGLVVAFTRDELLSRMAEFRDLSISDETIRQRYFPAARTPRYPPGDTRGWKLAAARRRLAACDDWKSAARVCLYRPFDPRWIYWSETMIDWPRRAIMRHLETPGNVALIARRQMPPTEPCRYFFLTHNITLDGVIRSDNRGGESIFPLFLREEVQTSAPARVNLAPEFVAAFPTLASGESCEAAAVRIFHYLYALVHAPSYRTRFAEHLRIDFPRVFAPRRESLFFTMSELGKQLAALHGPAETSVGGNTAAFVAAGFPKFANERVYLNPEFSVPEVSRVAWEWRVGGHHVCRKWLKDRKGRTLTEADLAAYRQVVAAATNTPSLAEEIDRTIEAHGGWPAAFVGRGAGA
jgi:hypothetical protein